MVGSRRVCCVVGCTNNEYNVKKNPFLYFYCFPGRIWEHERKMAWVKAIGRVDKDGKPWTPSNNARICSAHFVGGIKSNDPRSPAYNPTIFPPPPQTKPSSSNADVKSFHLLKRKYQKPETNVIPNSNAGSAVPHNTKREIAIQTDLPELDDNQERPVVLFCWNSATDVSTQTDIPRRATNTKRKIEKSAELITRQLGGIPASFFAILLSLIVSERKAPQLRGKTNILLLFLMKMKTGVTFSALGSIFGIDSTVAATLFFETLECLSRATASWIFWPFKDAVTNFYCRAIIDCIDIECDSPPTVEQRLSMYSAYKRCFTFRFLIGITPNGLISFLSKAYGGSTTNDFIINDSGFINLIESGDCIMADKSFSQMRPEVMGRKGSLITPSFSHSSRFLQESKTMALVRSDIERTIKGTKVYKILDNVDAELIPHIDNIMRMCCVLANHQPPS